MMGQQYDEEDMQLAKLEPQAVQPYRTDDDKPMMRYFEVEQETSASWVSTFVYNLQNRNDSVVKCQAKFNCMRDSLAFIRQYRPIDDLQREFERVRSDPSYRSDITFVPPSGHSLTTQIGLRGDGGVHKFFFFDTARVKRLKSAYGEFMSVSWTNIGAYNAMYSELIDRYSGRKNTMLQPSVAVNVPAETSQERVIFVRKFYNIYSEMNQRVFSEGELVHPISVVPYSLRDFNEQFALTESRSAEVDVIMGAVIEGYKQSKNEIKMELLHNEKCASKQYTLAIKPMIFFNIV